MIGMLLHTLLTWLLSGMLLQGSTARAIQGTIQSPGRFNTPRISGYAAEQGMDPGASIDPDVPVVVLDSIFYRILDLRLEAADSLLERSQQYNPGNPGTFYLINYGDFLDALIAGSRPEFEDYLRGSGERIGLLLQDTGKDPFAYSYVSSAHLQSSMLCAYHGEYFRAARHYYYAFRYLRQSELEAPGNPMNYRNRGLITLVSAAVPEEYRWILNVFGLRGDTEEGFGYLQEYMAAAAGPERLEACLLLMFAGQVLGTGDPVVNGRPDPPGCGEQAGARDYGQTLQRYARALADLSSGESKAVVENLGNYRQADGERAFPYLDLLLGEAGLQRLDSSAGPSLERFIRGNTGLHYRHYAWHRLSWHHALKGEWELYRAARRQVLECGDPYLDADRQSLAEAVDTLPLNIDLLKARLLFDGGDCLEALGALGKYSDSPDSTEEIKIPLLSRRDTIEYRYRLARIHERLGETGKAITGYDRVIASGSDGDWYFAPNAALHMGMIHEQAGNTEEAGKYYRICLKINRSAYEKSIDYRARQGLRRLEKIP